MKNQTALSAPRIGETVIARWKDDKQATFCLMFDDSIPSHVHTVVPELKKRGLVGTFYINPGGGAWKQLATDWEKQLPASPLVVYANHTMTHKGAHNTKELSDELRLCSEVIYSLVPGRRPRLIAFGRPGVKKEDWTVTDAEVQAVTNQLHLVERPPIGARIAMASVSTPEQMMALVETGLAKGTAESILFHGVGGDWIVTPTEMFVRFLDLLETKRSRLWITDSISAHKYQTEREGTEVKVLSADSHQIRLRLTTKTDPAFYDTPLTLTTRVPAAWKTCEIVQQATKTQGAAANQTMRYDALPNGETIILRPAR